METTESGAANGQRDDHGLPRSFGQRVDRIGSGAQQAWSRTRDSVGDLREALDLDGRVNRNPYGMIAAAVGVGYVLAGGIFSPLTGRILGFGLRLGLRVAAIPFIKDELLGMVQAVGGGSGLGSSLSGSEPEEASDEGVKSRRTKSQNTNKGRQP